MDGVVQASQSKGMVESSKDTSTPGKVGWTAFRVRPAWRLQGDGRRNMNLLQRVTTQLGVVKSDRLLDRGLLMFWGMAPIRQISIQAA